VNLADTRIHGMQPAGWLNYPIEEAYEHHDWANDPRMNGESHDLQTPAMAPYYQTGVGGYGAFAHRHMRTNTNTLMFDGSARSYKTVELDNMVVGDPACVWDN